jgi:putative transposase
VSLGDFSAGQASINWRAQQRRQGVAELRRVKQVEEENGRLKRLVADLTLDNESCSG